MPTNMAALSGRKTVTTAGTSEALGAVTAKVLGALYIKALAANTGVIEVGDSASAALAGYQLSAKEQVLLENVDNLGQIYIDTTVNGEGVSWLRMNAVR